MKFWQIIKNMNWASRLGLFIVSGFGFCAIFAPWLAPYGQSEIVGDVWGPLFGKFIFGTDQIGRDMLSMLIYGARNMIALALLTTGCAFGLGSLLGFLAATMGGWVDQVLSRFVDVVISIPTLIFALIVLSATGTSISALVIVIAIIYAMPVYRIARAVAMDIEVMEYVEVARLRGEGLWWIMRKEILPNALTPLAAEFGQRAQFSRPWPAAATCRLGFHGTGKRRWNCLGVYASAGTCHLHRPADHWHQPDCRFSSPESQRLARRPLTIRCRGQGIISTASKRVTRGAVSYSSLARKRSSTALKSVCRSQNMRCLPIATTFALGQPRSAL